MVNFITLAPVALWTGPYKNWSFFKNRRFYFRVYIREKLNLKLYIYIFQVWLPLFFTENLVHS